MYHNNLNNPKLNTHSVRVVTQAGFQKVSIKKAQ